MTEHTIFWDGAFIPADSRMIESLSPGHLKARGVFETMRADSGKIVLLNQHLLRLKKGLEILKIKSPYSNQELRGYINTLLSPLVSLRATEGSEAILFSKEKIASSRPARHLHDLAGGLSVAPRNDTTKNTRVRLTIWQDHKKTHASIVILPYEPFSRRKYEEGFKAVISPIRSHRSSRWSWVKSLDCLFLWQAYAEAKSKGYDEALILNAKGYLAEASRSNIFFVVKAELWTPALACGCLRGITRKVVITIARRMGMKVRTIPIKPEALGYAQEAFLTNSLLEIMPLTSVNGRRIGSGWAGPVTLQILRRYRGLVENRQSYPAARRPRTSPAR